MLPSSVDIPPVGPWQYATIIDVRRETDHVKTFRLELSQPAQHLSGQHYIVRLTAPDGYRAQRSYSVATPPDDCRHIELTIERLPRGEVSTFLHDESEIGDTIEVRGPIGGCFVWDGTTRALLLGGGSGVVPLMAMLRLARRAPINALAHLVVSVRRPRDLIYAAEMDGHDVTVLYTREVPSTTNRTVGRINLNDIKLLVHPDTTVYICGSTPFTEAASAVIVDAGVDSTRVRVERFGPT